MADYPPLNSTNNRFTMTGYPNRGGGNRQRPRPTMSSDPNWIYTHGAPFPQFSTTYFVKSWRSSRCALATHNNAKIMPAFKTTTTSKRGLVFRAPIVSMPS
jgi:hypothetical protein